MGEHIIPPLGDNDTEGAQRVFEEFFSLYQPTLSQLENYLETVMDAAGPAYAAAYRPWHQALQDLFRGVYLTVKKIPHPDTEGFVDAIRTFTFQGAIQFLADLASECRLTLERDWIQKFREHIDLLLFSVSILNRQHQKSSLAL